MKKKLLLIPLSALVCGALWFYWRQKMSADIATVGALNAQSKLAVEALKSAYEEAVGQGALIEAPPVQEALDQAIANGDRDVILRAFNEAVYDRLQDVEETRKVFLKFLTHTDWFVRKLAAESLYTMGDSSGFEVLRDLLLSTSPLMYADADERVSIAIKFGQWREKRAGPYMLKMYQDTGDARFLTGSEHLGLKDSALYSLSQLGSEIHDSTVVKYGIVKAPETKPILDSAFERLNSGSTEYPYVAWALYQYDPQRKYLNAIKQLAEGARLDPASDESFTPGTHAFRCLASIRDAEVKRIMEESLQSPSRSIREVAAASLLLIQEGKSEALVRFLKEHVAQNSKQQISASLGYQMAAHLDDPEVNAAGEARDKQEGENLWRYYGVKRKNWPVYPWSDGLLILP